ncbi:unnamed protein product, partial [Dovyalis caffra]
FIDLIQRLGVAYHFESEIDEMLHQFYDRSDDQDIDVHDLQMVALRFRLLRQQGHNISS